MPEPTWVSTLPPLLAIVLAVWSRQVYLSLAAGVWLGWTIVEGWNPLRGLATGIDQVIAVLGVPANTRVILFTLIIGALIATVEASGGVRGFVQWVEQKRFVTNGRRAQLLSWFIGLVIFIESNITVLVSGAIGRPLFDRFRVSREKLAYIIDSTSAAVCILIPLNAWGAYVLGLLEGSVERPFSVLVASIPFNFYAIGAVLLAAAAIAFRLDLGPMRAAEERTRGGQLLSTGAAPLLDPDVLAPKPNTRIPPRAINMIVPITAMVLAMPAAMWITGDGPGQIRTLVDAGQSTITSAFISIGAIRAGTGSLSVLWAVFAGLAVAWILLLAQRAYTVDDLVRTGLKGAGGLMSLALVLLLALALAAVANELGTGVYIAGLVAERLPVTLLLPLVFIASAGVAFSTGTSWGTFAIMVPIAIPTALVLGLPPAPFLAAALSGGIFGDHSSPISDTTIIASMAAATDHIDHVRTQLPYALLAGAVAAAGFAAVGAIL